MNYHLLSSESNQSTFPTQNGHAFRHATPCPLYDGAQQPRQEGPAERQRLRRAVMARSRLHLAIELCDLGQLDAALATILEAVDLYRSLAREQPETFRPCLAHGLHRLSALLRKLGEVDSALWAAEEAMRVLAPFFLQQPRGFGHWMNRVEVEYRAAALAADAEADPALIAPILAVLRPPPGHAAAAAAAT